MIGWLTGASGGTLLAVAVPLALLVTGGSYIKGRMDGYSLCEAKALEAGLNLDKISGEVSINIADAVNSYKQGYDARNSNTVKVNTDAIEAAALKIWKDRPRVTKKDLKMQPRLKTLVIMTLTFFLTACATGPKVDTKRFSEARNLLASLPPPPQCQTAPETLLGLTRKPVDTSNGIFNTLKDVGEQDAAYGAYLPILQERFRLLSDQVARDRQSNTLNHEEYLKTINDIRGIFDDVLEENTSKRFSFGR